MNCMRIFETQVVLFGYVCSYLLYNHASCDNKYIFPVLFVSCTEPVAQKVLVILNFAFYVALLVQDISFKTCGDILFMRYSVHKYYE
jgi:hypothetical protein